MSVIEEIKVERARQMEQEGWDAAHDDQHTDGSLAQAAACYALTERSIGSRTVFQVIENEIFYRDIPLAWPRSWHPKWWKPKNRRHDLIRAAALIVAEIERIDRANP